MSYTSGTDTTTIDNNVTISSGKNLLIGTTNVLSNINTANSNISTLQGQMTTANSNISTLQGQMTTANNTIATYSSSINTLNQKMTDITYDSGNDLTNINNNVIVYGKDNKTYPNEAFKVVDSTQNQDITLMPKVTQGSYNVIVANDDAVLMAKDTTGAVDTTLTITGWNSKPYGLRLGPNKTFLGCSNSSYLNTDSLTVPSTHIYLNGTAEQIDMYGLNTINNNINVKKQVEVSFSFPITLANTGSAVTFGNIVYANSARRVATITIPLSFYRQYRLSATTTITITDTISAIGIQVNKNGTLYQNVTPSCNTALPITARLSNTTTANGTLTTELFLTMLSFSFIIDSETNTSDTYSFVITPTINTTYSFNTGLFTINNFGVRTNTTVSSISNGVGNQIQNISSSTYQPLAILYQDLPYTTSSTDKIEAPVLSANTVVANTVNCNRIYTESFGLCGWMLDESGVFNNYPIYYPIVSSMKRLRLDIADFCIVLPKYKFVFYINDDYGGTSTTFDNQTGTSAQLYQFTGSSIGSNSANSVKVYYKPDYNTAEREITINAIS